MFKLEILDLYYRKNRQVGHTFAMLNGAKSDKDIIVIIAEETQKSYIELPKRQMINMSNLHEKLLGRKNPILVDHFAIQLMYWDMKKELEKKDEEIETLKTLNKILKRRLEIIKNCL